ILLVLAVLLAALALVEPALAQQSPLQMTTSPLAGGGTQYSVPVQTLLFLTVLSFLPAVLLMMTSFTRLVIVLSLLRMALGGAAELPMRVVIPAFVTSELKTAFQIGFMVFIPFLIIDMVVASVLMSMGMMMLSPVLVSLPFKLMLFVLADGWNLLIGSLVASYST